MSSVIYYQHRNGQTGFCFGDDEMSSYKQHIAKNAENKAGLILLDSSKKVLYSNKNYFTQSYKDQTTSTSIIFNSSYCQIWCMSPF